MINLCQTSKANNVSLLNTVNVKVFPNEQVYSIFYARKKKKEKERKTETFLNVLIQKQNILDFVLYSYL